MTHWKKFYDYRFISGEELDGKESNYTLIQATGTGAYTITLSVNGDQTTHRVSGHFYKVIKVQPGDVVTFGAKANRYDVSIEIDDLGCTVISYNYAKISKTF